MRELLQQLKLLQQLCCFAKILDLDFSAFPRIRLLLGCDLDPNSGAHQLPSGLLGYWRDSGVAFLQCDGVGSFTLHPTPHKSGPFLQNCHDAAARQLGDRIEVSLIGECDDEPVIRIVCQSFSVHACSADALDRLAPDWKPGDCVRPGIEEWARRQFKGH